MRRCAVRSACAVQAVLLGWMCSSYMHMHGPCRLDTPQIHRNVTVTICRRPAAGRLVVCHVAEQRLRAPSLLPRSATAA